MATNSNILAWEIPWTEGAEFMRLLGERQGTLLLLEMLQPEFQHLHQFLEHNFPQGSAKASNPATVLG